MPVPHAHVTTVTTVTSTDDELPSLLEVLGRVPDPRRRRGRRYTLVFLLAVAVACVLAWARNFREVGDQASDLPQEVLARLGGRPHPLLRTIIAPSEKRIRTVLQEIDAATLDALTGGWLRELADAGRLENLLRAIAIDGKWLRGIGDGQQVKLFAAMLHEEKVIIAQHAIPEDTNEITQVRELLDPVDLNGAVVTGDAAHAQRDTAAYIAGPAEDGGRESDYFLLVKGNQPSLQRAVYDAIQAGCPREPDHVEIDYSHGRIIRRSLWVIPTSRTLVPSMAARISEITATAAPHASHFSCWRRSPDARRQLSTWRATNDSPIPTIATRTGTISQAGGLPNHPAS
jgi:predicted transposase YbfD/YdcC